MGVENVLPPFFKNLNIILINPYALKYLKGLLTRERIEFIKGYYDVTTNNYK